MHWQGSDLHWTVIGCLWGRGGGVLQYGVLLYGCVTL